MVREHLLRKHCTRVEMKEVREQASRACGGGASWQRKQHVQRPGGGKKFGMSGKQKDRILLTAHDIFLFCCCSHFADEKKLER